MAENGLQEDPQPSWWQKTSTGWSEEEPKPRVPADLRQVEVLEKAVSEALAEQEEG
jgi:hypothetical protein